MQHNPEQTIEQIENAYWTEPGYDSHLVITCFNLRKKPLKDFTVEDLRIMIGQNISLDILVPIAFEKLKQNIMAEGDLYPGDLLHNVLRADKKFWRKNPLIHRRLKKLYLNNLPAMQKQADKSGAARSMEKQLETFDDFCNVEFEDSE